MFRPSKSSAHAYGCTCFGCMDAYGWAAAYPVSVLTASGTASSQGLSNTPTTSASNNLSRVSDFLNMLPWRVQVTSGYRSPAVNAAVGGASGSAHMTGEAVDFKVPGWNSRKTATWLWKNRSRFPMLDQVAWYTGNKGTHVHVTVRSNGRQAFYSAHNGNWQSWTPTAADLAGVQGALVAWRRYVVLSGLTAAAFAGFVWWRKHR